MGYYCFSGWSTSLLTSRLSFCLSILEMYFCIRVPVRTYSCGNRQWSVISVSVCVFSPAKVLQDLFICNDDVHVSFRLSLCWGDSRFWWPFGCGHCLPGTECFVAAVGSVNHLPTWPTCFVMFYKLCCILLNWDGVDVYASSRSISCTTFGILEEHISLHLRVIVLSVL